jgi:transcriptional regulator with XRE-family HTH domain
MDEKELKVTERRIGLYQAIWARGWTQEKFAEETGIPRSSLSLIMTGRLTPYPSQVQKIIDVLGQDEKTLFL